MLKPYKVLRQMSWISIGQTRNNFPQKSCGQLLNGSILLWLLGWLVSSVTSLDYGHGESLDVPQRSA